MTVIIIPCFTYYYETEPLERIRILTYEFILKNIDRYAADVVCFVGRNCGFETHTEMRGNKELRFINTADYDPMYGDGRIEFNTFAAVNTMSSGDKLILADLDLIVYDPAYFTEIFSDLDKYDVVSTLDTHATMPTYRKFNDRPANGWINDDHRDLSYRLEIMRPTPYRDGKSRFAHFTFACSYDFFKSVTNTPATMDDFTRLVATKFPNARIKEIISHRNTVGIRSSNPDPESLDTGGFSLSGDGNDDVRCTEESFAKIKAFHIGAFSHIPISVLHLLGLRQNSIMDSGDIVLMPFYICWAITMMDRVYDDATKARYLALFDTALKKYNIGLDTPYFKRYHQLFKSYYRTHLL